MHLSLCQQLCFLFYWTAAAFGQQGCNVTNKFGKDCRYTCHCIAQSTCNQDGSCIEGCGFDFFGPACQYSDMVNLASLHVTENETSKQYVYTYTWNNLFKFTWMNLQFNEPFTGKNLNILLRNEGALQLCEKSIVTVIDDYTYTVHCDSVVWINSLTIDTNSRVPRKEIHISGGLFDAVEGSTKGYKCTSSLVNTTNADVNNKDILLNHYMFSKLDGQNQLFRLVKYSSSEIYSFNDSGHLAFMYMRNNETLQLITYKELYLNVFSTGVILGLCEVHLIEEIQCAEIPRYMVDCNRRSNCLNQADVCLFSTGQCPSGCPVGFTDECCTHYAPPKTCPIRKPNRNFIDKTKVV